MPDILSWVPSDLSIGHLEPTWLFWLLLVLLIVELAWMAPKMITYLRQAQTNSKAPAGPWGTAATPSRLLTWSMTITLVLSSLTVLALVFLSAAGFYLAALSLISRVMRFAARYPHAHGGEEVGSVIGELIGGLVQISLIMGVFASIDPASQFPFRLSSHLSPESAAQ